MLSEKFSRYSEAHLSGRYITNADILPLIKKHEQKFANKVLGKSVLGNDVWSVSVGSGKTRILIWSQMHGNESTTTKAIFDCLNFLESNNEIAARILESCTLLVIPILNPDGAEMYTRENANNIDLNRDFIDLSQPESNILFETFATFKPHYCFNMHDQRTIYGAGQTGEPATVSFLAPSYNEALEVNKSRAEAMEIISVMNDALQKIIPGRVGRFDDAFNRNCVGDTFQSMGVPTILFEAGHYPKDYGREKTRNCIFLSLITALHYISDNIVVGNKNAEYLNIPQNKIVFYDFVYRNVKINYDNKEIITNFAAQYKEELKGKEITFNAYIEEVGDLSGCFGHHDFDAAGEKYADNHANIPQAEQKADFYLGTEKFVNGSLVEKN